MPKSAKLADLDRPKPNAKKGFSKISIFSFAVVVALSTIGGAWMVVRLSIHSKAQGDSVDANANRAMKKFTPVAENRDEEMLIATTPAPIIEARPDPTTPAQIPEEKQESGSLH